jgi:hypothetical protein
MISIIISSYQPEYLNAFSKNIAENTGVPYELIVVENKNAMSLCAAYNIGAKKARYNFLCFSHEDILIQTDNWGSKVVELFQSNNELGLIGVAGNTYKPIMPTHWSFPGADLKTFYMNIFQEYKYEGKRATHMLYNPKSERLSYVAAIDGVWFCTKKEIITENPFDETTFTSFHAYDVDISLAIGRKYKVAVTFDIDIHHFSEGGFGKSWIEETLKLHNKWLPELPKNIENFKYAEQQREEKKAFLYFAYLMINNRYSLKDVYKLFKYQNSNFGFSLINRIELQFRVLTYKFGRYKL